MKAFNDMSALPRFRRPVVTVGSFDGVHRGHLFLLDVLRQRAATVGGESVVVTFGDHPRVVLDEAAAMRVLTPTAEKARLLEAAGVDNLVVMPFDETVARQSAEQFVREFLLGRLGMYELVVGYNHRLGRDREGDAAELTALGQRFGFDVFLAPRFQPGGSDGDGPDEKISSTAIRNALERGDTATAERMLGRRLGK